MRPEELEIMAPAGSFESLTAAIQGGADSVYFGIGHLNMRSHSANNFQAEDLPEVMRICRAYGLKAYLTLNITLYGEELEEAHRVLDLAKETGVNAVIASDMACILYARSIGLEVHISTQLSISNAEALRFYAQFADVVVLARELRLEQVKTIHETIVRERITGPSGELVRIEMFAHGAFCMAISGKCYLSLAAYGESANRGACMQVCRRGYHVTDEETGFDLVVDNKYIMSPKDLCTIEFMDKIIDAGVKVFKIEGRARSADYVKITAQCYREAADAVGEFDEQFFPVGFEDADYALRLRRAGYSLLRVGTYVHNCGGSYLDDGASWSDTWERNQALFHKKWGIIPGYSLMVRLDILKHIDMGKENLSVLDVGCACGTNLMWLKSYHPEARLCGIELNEKSASIAQWFGQVEALDVETLEREEWRNSFDYIILADIVEHLKDPWSLLKRMKGFLKQGGRLIISVPNVCHISNLQNMLHGNWEYKNTGILDRTHLRFFTKKSFAKCLEEAGLSIISTEPNHILADHQRRLLQELSSLDDTDITQEELSAIQWIFVAEKMISAQSPTGERSRCARPN